MQSSNPHYLLFSEGSFDGDQPGWKFVLQAVGSDEHFSAADTECESRASRLELLAVVRGLEALGQPSQVTLLTRSRYVRRGIRRELAQWRDRRWHWERFGNVVPIRDCDLWQRVDRAMQYHQVKCCAWSNEDSADENVAARRSAGQTSSSSRQSQQAAWNIAAMFGELRRSVLAPIQSIWRQPFTRAA
jgi:ribonuclease HI